MSYVVLREQDVSSSATTLATVDVVITPLLLVVRKVGGKDIRILFSSERDHYLWATTTTITGVEELHSPGYSLWAYEWC